MPKGIKLVERNSPSTVFFDFDDATGTVNPYGLLTVTQRVSPGDIQRSLSTLKQKGAPLGVRTIADPQFRRVLILFGARAADTDLSLNSLEHGLGELYRVLQSDAVTEYLLAWNNGIETRYFEPLGLDTGLSELQLSESQAVTAARGEVVNLNLEITCQPFPLSDEVKSDTNMLVNGTLGVEGSTAGRPDGWAWDSTSNISLEAIYALDDAYRVQSATASARNLQQTTAVGTAAPSDRHVFSFYARAGTAGVYNVQAVIRYADAAGSLLGSEMLSTLTSVGVTRTRVSVVGTSAPASTSRVTVSIRVTNPSASAVPLYLRDAQLESGTTLTTFHAGNYTLSPNPTQTYGLVVPIVVGGTAPTAVSFDLQSGTSVNMVSARMGARWNRSQDGSFSILDYQNATYWVPAAASADGWTVTNNYSGAAVVTDTGAASGSALQITVNPGDNGVRLRRFRALRTTQRDSLRGEFAVYACIAAQEGDIDWQIQMHYGSANTDPLPNSEDPIVYTVPGDTGFQIGYDYVFLGVFRSSEFADITAVATELWIARKNDSNVTGHLRISHLALVPYEQRTLMEIPGGGKVTWKDDDWINGPNNIAVVSGDPIGGWAPGDVGDGGGMVLNASGEAAAIRPVGGQAYGSGLVRMEFDIRRADEPNRGSKGYMARIVDVTGSPSTPPTVVAAQEITQAKVWKVKFISIAGHLYQPQVTHRGGAGNRLVVSQITKKFIPATIPTERIVSDPEHYEAMKQDASGNIIAPINVQGQTPFMMEPGRYIVCILSGEVPKGNHDNDNVVMTAGHTLTVRHRYTPRWTQ